MLHDQHMKPTRILVIDDQPSASSLVTLILNRSGFETRAENFPAHALSTALSFQPDIILLDVDMPGKDGGEVAHDMRAEPQLRDVPIVFLTSLVSATEAGKGPIMRGGMPFLSKPVNPSILTATVKRYLRESGTPVSRTLAMA